MVKRFRTILISLFFMVSLGCGQPTPVLTATLQVVPTDTPYPTETPLPALTSTPTEEPREPTGPQAGTTLLYKDGSTLIYIPAGEFEMGGDGKDNPLHTVSLRGYWIQKTEVTRAMYANCLDIGLCIDFIDYKTSGYLNDSAHSYKPVVGVKHEQAQSYCVSIGGRLPSEAEWEYAARGSSGITYPWGNDEPTCDLLNFNNCVGGVTRVTNYQADKSPFGVLGMAGNVREWVNDYFDGTYDKNSPSQNPTGPISGNYYVVRGAGYDSAADESKAFFRGFFKKAGYARDLGFRCVVDNPVIYAPYCQSAQFTQDVQATQPMDRCAPMILEVPTKCNAIKGNVTGGNLISVDITTPLSIDCKVEDLKTLFCEGTYMNKGGSLSYPVTACVICAGGSSTSAPPLECPINYQLAENSGYCEYVGGPWTGYCPPSSAPLNENQCVYQEAQSGDCPIGSYFDRGMNACVTMGQTTLICGDGYRYDFDHSCCVPSQPQVAFPLCNDDEYYSSEYGCVPLPKPDGIESCGTTTMPFNMCQ